MYFTSRIVVKESINRKNFEDQQNLQKQRKSINCDKIFQFLSKFQSKQKCYTVISRLSKNELDRVAMGVATWVEHSKVPGGKMIQVKKMSLRQKCDKNVTWTKMSLGQY